MQKYFVIFTALALFPVIPHSLCRGQENTFVHTTGSTASSAFSAAKEPSVLSAQTGSAGAQGSYGESVEKAPQEKSLSKTISSAVRFVDNTHEIISRHILTNAAWLDSFFCNERSLAEENRTSISVRYDIFLEEKSGVTSDPRVRFRLVLPQLQKRTHLLFYAEPSSSLPPGASAEENTTGSRVSTSIPETTATDQRNFTTALHYFLAANARQNFSVRTGMKFHDKRPVLFGSPRYRVLLPIDSWALRFTQEIVYRTDTAWQEETKVDLERPLHYSFFFRSTFDGIWLESKKGYFYSFNFVLVHVLGPHNALSYEWTNNLQTSPVNKLTEVALRVRYRRQFLREWLFFEVAPQIRFPRDRNMQITPGILFSLETFFGRMPWQ